MRSRKTMLGLSFCCALLLYAILFALAPRIMVIQANSARKDVLAAFRVDIFNKPLPERPDPAAPAAETLASRPGSVRDLLARELDEIKPLERLDHEEAEIPSQVERAGKEDLERAHDLEVDENTLKKVDARIVEIAQEAARRNIEVARRLVRPSPVRVVRKGEYPTLRGRRGDRVGVVPLAPRPSLLAESAGGVEGAGEPGGVGAKTERPAFEEGVLSPDVAESGLPELPVETVVALAPVRAAIRRESRYEFLDDLVRIELDTYVPPGEPTGFFRLRIEAKQNEGIAALPKDVTFVLDASNSIVQRKLDLTVRGLKDCIALLRPEDRFNIVVFRDKPAFFKSDVAEASRETKEAAYAFLDALESRGETDVYSAVRPVIQKPPPAGRAGIVVLLSDGRPTKGVMNGRDIINAVTADNVHRNSVYTFGGGRTVNRYLLDLLAYRNKGDSQVVRRMDDIDEALPRFFERLDQPVLIGLGADYGRIDETSIYPREIPDFFAGRAVMVFGRFTPALDKEFVMRLTGRAEQGEKELVFKADLGKAGKGDAAIARQWAFQRIYHLIGEIVRLGEQPELLSELRRLSREYDIQTSYTQ